MKLKYLPYTWHIVSLISKFLLVAKNKIKDITTVKGTMNHNIKYRNSGFRNIITSALLFVNSVFYKNIYNLYIGYI